METKYRVNFVFSTAEALQWLDTAGEPESNVLRVFRALDEALVDLLEDDADVLSWALHRDRAALWGRVVTQRVTVTVVGDPSAPVPQNARSRYDGVLSQAFENLECYYKEA